MPTLKKYVNKNGYYLHGKVGDKVVTLQTSPRAWRLFDRLGYTHGKSISWQMVSNLKERGDVYTQGEKLPETIQDTTVSLSDKQHRIYQKYLHGNFIDGEDLTIVKNAVKELFDASLYERQDIEQQIVDKAQKGNIRSLDAFRSAPWKALNINLKGKETVYTFDADDAVTVHITDRRWNHRPGSHFSGRVEYANQPDAQFTILDGYFSSWEYKNTSESNRDADIEEVHKWAFKSIPNEFGFNIDDWTDVVRRLMLYVTGYDIRPYHSGHRSLASQQEFAGKEIWVKAHTTNTSSGQANNPTLIITDELIEIWLPTIDSDDIGWHFIRVGEINHKGKARGEPAEFITS